mmetsp:Transcript_49361/g.130890  ORF Transcript_49361/g.130890 Transcript_49361/m.130890 type:complete len:375 (-) Transcript_49361:365-1489(-)
MGAQDSKGTVLSTVEDGDSCDVRTSRTGGASSARNHTKDSCGSTATYSSAATTSSNGGSRRVSKEPNRKQSKESTSTKASAASYTSSKFVKPIVWAGSRRSSKDSASTSKSTPFSIFLPSCLFVNYWAQKSTETPGAPPGEVEKNQSEGVRYRKDFGHPVVETAAVDAASQDGENLEPERQMEDGQGPDDECRDSTRTRSRSRKRSPPPLQQELSKTTTPRSETRAATPNQDRKSEPAGEDSRRVGESARRREALSKQTAELEYNLWQEHQRRLHDEMRQKNAVRHVRDRSSLSKEDERDSDRERHPRDQVRRYSPERQLQRNSRDRSSRTEKVDAVQERRGSRDEDLRQFNKYLRCRESFDGARFSGARSAER